MLNPGSSRSVAITGVISDDVDDKEKDQCRSKCSIEQAACLLRSAKAKCQMKFKISGYYRIQKGFS